MATIAVATAARKNKSSKDGSNFDGGKLRQDSKAGELADRDRLDPKHSRRESIKKNLKSLHRLSTEQIQGLMDKLAPQPLVPFNVKIILLWVTWLFGGALVYMLINGWSYPQAFYYACNVGYSIGYGALYEYNDLSLAWSLFMIFMGSSVIGGAIGYFASAAIEASGDFHEEEEEEEDGCCTRLSEHISKFYKANETQVKVFSLLGVWIILGTLYGTLHEGWSVLRSVYFAVSGMSTAGLQAPSTIGEGREKYMPYSSSWFVGFFSATGVPIFGLALGQLGGFFVDAYIAKNTLCI